MLLGAILRFYRLPQMANFDFDQQYASNFAYSVLKEYPLQLIGQGLSIQGLFMGPLYFYYLVPFYAVTNLHPIGGFVGSVILGLITIFIYFWVAKKMFGVAAGITAAFLRAILFSFIEIDWTLTPAFSSDIIVILISYFLYNYWQGKIYYLIPLAFCFGLFTSFHPILIPFYLVFVVIFLIKRSVPNFRILTLCILAFIIPIIPLIIFEYLHNFLEIKELFALVGDIGGEKNYLEAFTNNLKINLYEPYRILGIRHIPIVPFTLFLFTSLMILISARISFWKNNFHATFLLLTFIIFLIYYTFFPANISEYYFSGTTILITFYTICSLALLIKKRLPLFLVILVFISFSNFTLIQDKWNDQFLTTLYHKDFIVKEVLKRQDPNQEFYVSYIKHLGWDFGFEYLFKAYGRIPQKIEAKTPVYTIVIPKSLAEDSIDIVSGDIGLILPK